MKLLSKKEVLARKEEYRPVGMIYFLIKGNEIVYVGQTKQGLQRIRSHTWPSGTVKAKEFDYVSYVECPVERLTETEANYIVKFSPVLNGPMLPRNDRYKSKPMIKRQYNVKGPALNRILKKHKATIYYGQYYDIAELASTGAIAEIQANCGGTY